VLGSSSGHWWAKPDWRFTKTPVKLIAAVSGLEQAIEARMSVMRRMVQMKGERIEALRMEIRDRRDACGACVLMTTPRD
jgi:hypothetical protein